MTDLALFLPTPPDPTKVYVGSYDATLVIAAILFSIIASYAALHISIRIRHFAEATSKIAWSLISASILGIAIWATHFIVMLAFSLPCVVNYNLLISLLSIIPAVLASWMALFGTWQHRAKPLSPLVGSVLLSGGMGIMHHIGMTAMQMEGLVRYDFTLFLCSILVALTLSFFALSWLANVGYQDNNKSLMLASVLMGGAISCMHLTAMSAAYFLRGPLTPMLGIVINTNILAVILVASTFFLGLGALIFASLERIKQLAFYDPLTQLPNRRLMQERLKHGIDKARRDGNQLALLMLDLDRFKIVNDSLGHRMGDELLQQVAARMKAILRTVDTVARLGGDEFVVILEDIAMPDYAALVSKKIVTSLSNPFQLGQNDDVRIGASIGISMFPQHGENVEILLDRADTALYRAKDQGRGCFAFFSESMTLATRERIMLEVRLQKAVRQKELRVYYQPQVDIATGRIIGAEALVRWQDPIEGLIPPSRFIPIAEETNLIVEIGELVLRETCAQGRQWLYMGLPPLTLAVNVSPQQFRRSDIATLVAGVLAETGFPAGQLELEITESGLMENKDNAVAILNKLHAQGIRLAIDDFGTGYSSLANLKHFHLDVLKIDKSFIDEIPHNKDDMEIAATIVAMGHTLGFKVLAEGVETKEQLAFLQKTGCDAYQGYLIGRPVPAEEFIKLYLDNWLEYKLIPT